MKKKKKKIIHAHTHNIHVIFCPFAAYALVSPPQAHMTISDHKELVVKWVTSRKQILPILADVAGGNKATASSEDTHDE